jgi:hypothetical protein
VEGEDPPPLDLRRNGDGDRGHERADRDHDRDDGDPEGLEIATTLLPKTGKHGFKKREVHPVRRRPWLRDEEGLAGSVLVLRPVQRVQVVVELPKTLLASTPRSCTIAGMSMGTSIFV